MGLQVAMVQVQRETIWLLHVSTTLSARKNWHAITIDDILVGELSELLNTHTYAISEDEPMARDISAEVSRTPLRCDVRTRGWRLAKNSARPNIPSTDCLRSIASINLRISDLQLYIK